jgi:hypothetical protein
MSVSGEKPANANRQSASDKSSSNDSKTGRQKQAMSGTNKQQDLANLVARHEALSGELTGAQATLEVARRQLSADMSNLETVTAAQARVSAIEGAIETLSGEINTKRAEVAEHETQQASAARRRRTDEIAAARSQAAADFNEARERASDALNEPLRTMREAVARRIELDREDTQLKLAEGLTVSPQATANDFARREVAHGESIDLAYHAELNRIEREKRKSELRAASRLRGEREREQERTRAAQVAAARDARNAEAARIEAWRTGAAA